MDKKLFASRVRLLREFRGLSREQLGELAGVSYSQVVNWELGRRGAAMKRLPMLFDALGVTAEQFWDKAYIPGQQSELSFEGVRIDQKRAIGELPTDIREDKRAESCPRCKRHGFGDKARYCPICGFPLYNFCATEERHANDPAACHCESCGERTIWSMSVAELERAGVPPLRVQPTHNNARSTQSAPDRR